MWWCYPACIRSPSLCPLIGIHSSSLGGVTTEVYVDEQPCLTLGLLHMLIFQPFFPLPRIQSQLLSLSPYYRKTALNASSLLLVRMKAVFWEKFMF